MSYIQALMAYLKYDCRSSSISTLDMCICSHRCEFPRQTPRKVLEIRSALSISVHSKYIISLSRGFLWRTPITRVFITYTCRILYDCIVNITCHVTNVTRTSRCGDSAANAEWPITYMYIRCSSNYDRRLVYLSPAVNFYYLVTFTAYTIGPSETNANAGVST